MLGRLLLRDFCRVSGWLSWFLSALEPFDEAYLFYLADDAVVNDVFGGDFACIHG
jgi:hypothetical protein